MSLREPVTMKEEQTELQILRERAEQDGREAADTLAALAGKLSEARRPGTVARRFMDKLPGSQAAQRAMLAGVPVGLIAVTAVVFLLRRRIR